MSDRILIVDDEPAQREMLGALLRTLGYECMEAADGIAVLECLREQECALVLADLRMPGMDGIELLRFLTDTREDIAVVIITGYADVESAVTALKIGAYDYIVKPIESLALSQAIAHALERRRLRIENREYQRSLERLVEQRTSELMTTYRQTLHALASALDTRDPETQEHAERVVRYTLAIAQEMGVHGAHLRDIEGGAILHDVGKIGVPDAILFKPGALTSEEWAKMREHPEIGYRMLKDIPFLQGAVPVVRHHHERWDGSGYPLRLKGEEIPFGARIFAIADAFDAITSERPYKAPLPPEDAKAEILRSSGVHFAPEAVEAFVRAYEQESSPLRSRCDGGK